MHGSDLGKNAYFEAVHVEEEVGVVLAVDGDEAALPLDGGQGARQPILDLPKGSPAEVDVVLHESHAAVPRPAFLVVVANDVLIVRIRILRQVTLDEVTGLSLTEAEDDLQSVDVSAVQPNRMARLALNILETHELIGCTWQSRKIGCSLQT